MIKNFRPPPTDHMLICNLPGKAFENLFDQECQIKYLTYPRIPDCSICGDAETIDFMSEKVPPEILAKYIEPPSEDTPDSP